MLQQILRDLYVDPEILAELDEQQKQTLFCKMREEQVRRWKSWDEKISTDSPPPPPLPSRKSRKSVSFMLGVDGEPWVWVMGEHENDKSIEEILQEEAMEKARKIAEREAVELRKQVEATLSDYIELSPRIEEDMDIYYSVEEMREMRANSKSGNYSLNHYQERNNRLNLIDSREVLQEIALNAPKVSQKIALWEKRVTEQRTSEILKTLQRKQQEVEKEAEEAEKKQEVFWREQERKAKQAEQQIREIARKAREEHRLACGGFQIECTYGSVAAEAPSSKQEVVDWYKNKERIRSAELNAVFEYEPWFHGLISRSEAESRLQGQPDGSFLVRLSERIWGYAISYKTRDKCKHYLISASHKYSFLGSNQIEHKTLRDLIDYHMEYPLSGGEKLDHPCPRKDDQPIS